MNPAYLKNAGTKKKVMLLQKLNPFFGVHTTVHSHVGMGMGMEWRALGFKGVRESGWRITYAVTIVGPAC
jgi:hypothetical protein